MSNPNTPNSPQGQDSGERINQALQQTGQRLTEELNTAGDRVRQFVEDNKVNEQLEVAGNQVVDRVKDLIQEGNVRRLILRNTEGRVLLEIPLTAGVAVGGAVLWMNPLLAGLGAIAALIARINIEIVRDEPEAIVQDVKQKAKEIGSDVKDAAKDVAKSVSSGSGSGQGGSSSGSGSSGSSSNS
jgi:hypothetical protein